MTTQVVEGRVIRRLVPATLAVALIVGVAAVALVLDTRADLAATHASLADTQDGLLVALEDLTDTRAELNAARADLSTISDGLDEAKASLESTDAELAAGVRAGEAARVLLAQDRDSMKDDLVTVQANLSTASGDLNNLVQESAVMESKLDTVASDILAAGGDLLDLRDDVGINYQMVSQTRTDIRGLQNSVAAVADQTAKLEYGFRDIYREVVYSVFCLEVSVGCAGTGWLIGDGLIITAQHVVGWAGRGVIVRQASYAPFSATVLSVDRQHDIALLSFDPDVAKLDHRAKPLSLGYATTYGNGMPLMALGFAGSGVYANGTTGSASANAGILSQLINFGANSLGSNLVMDVPIDPGDSGGPVFNVEGEVVGMSRAVVEIMYGRRWVGTFYAVDVAEILAAYPYLD